MLIKKRTIPWTDLLTVIPLENGFAHDITIMPETIPVIFIPGIMGSILDSLKDNEQVWDPDDKVYTLFRFGRLDTGPKKKREAFLGNGKHKNTFLAVRGGNEVSSETRGWEGVYQDSYKSIRHNLENLSTSREVHTCFDTPAHAFGYNWTNSPRESGKALATFIEQLIAYYSNSGDHCERVILVTHSMGGLVARSACRLAGATKRVLGVMHVAQPATGAPAAYWRMKAGFERSKDDFFLSEVAAWVLGTDGEEVTAVLGHMPGGLALLPNAQYTDAKNESAWLRVTTDHATLGCWPKHGDPYAEIYRNKTDLWRLVDPKLLLGTDDRELAWAWYLAALEQAESFHRDLGLWQHPYTWHFDGAGLLTADAIDLRLKHFKMWYMTYGTDDMVEMTKSLDPPETLEPHKLAALPHHYGRGRYFAGKHVVGENFQAVLQPFNADGDGTVPTSSARHLRERTPANRSDRAKPMPHEPAMKDPKTIAFISRAITDLLHHAIAVAAKELDRKEKAATATKSTP